MDNESIPTFSTKAEVEKVESPNDSTKTPMEIAENVSIQYASPGNIAQPKIRKKRSDAGIPRGSRKSVATDATQSQNVSDAKNGQASSYAIDRAVVEKTAFTVLNTVDAMLIRKIGNTAIKLGADNDFAGELAKNAGLSVDEAKLMSELTGIVFEKHGLLTGYAPEMLLGIMLSEWSVRVMLVMRQLTFLGQQYSRKIRQNETTSSSDKNDHNR